MPHDVEIDLAKRARHVVVATACMVVASMPARAAPCELLANQPSTDLSSCVRVPPTTGHVRRLDIDLIWAGPGVAHRVLDLQLPNNPQFEARQLQLNAHGSTTDEPARVLQRLGIDSRYSERHLQSPRLALELDIAPGRHRIELDYQLPLGGHLYPLLDVESAWRERNAFKDMFSGLLWGVGLTSSLGVLMSRVLTRDASARAYVLLVVIQGIGLALIRGDAFAYLWPDAPLFEQALLLSVMLLAGCSHAWFAMRFLRLRDRSPRLYRLHLAMMVLFALDFLLLPITAAQIGGGALAVTYSALALFTAGRSWRSGTPDLRLYTVGASAHVLLTVATIVVGVAGHNPWPRFDYFMLPALGNLIETTFFGAALYWRARETRSRQETARNQRVKDTLALVEAESARQAADARAARSNLLFAGAGHDLSQPLTSVSMALGALSVQEGQAPIAEHLHRTIAYAQTLLRDILAEARGEHVEHDDRFVLGDCIAQVVREHRPGATAKGLSLDFVHSQVEVGISALLLGRVLNNLVSNAVRYTSRGRVLVGVRRRVGGVEIQVLDTGPGLPPGRLSLLQRPFAQGASDAPEGHGLGLFIVRTLCQQGGFPFRVASRPGRGSAFCVWIPHGSA